MTRLSAAAARRLLRERGRPIASVRGSDLERALEAHLHMLGPDLPLAEREPIFALGRGWRFDFAWPDQRFAVEVDGGQWAAGGGRHNQDSDREKLNAAAVLGWRVLRFSGAMLERDPAGCVETIRAALVSGAAPREEKAAR